ncbi:MAG TPA: hypothetical protein VKR53_17685 [Puia sp.]|nr:hypothetical protein [Puia sp.]
MRTSKHIPVLEIACIIILFLGSCTKENVAPAAKSSIVNADEMVLTPVGLMEKSKVHFIGDGFQLNVANGRLQKIASASGKMIEDFGEVKYDARLNLNQPDGSRFSDDRYPAASGWIAYAYWSNPNTGNPITNFTTNWVVPSAPTSQGNQTIFLFNGMQDGTTSTSYIVQPVLQWGPSAAGGGKYWSITNWYVSSSQAFFGTLVNVSTGASLQGVMKQTAHSGNNYSYNSSFAGYSSASALQVNNVPEAFWAAETLESYGVSNTSTQYPPNVDIAMKSIQILQGTANASIKWTTAQAARNAAQKAVVVSNSSPNGEVDIYFRK